MLACIAAGGLVASSSTHLAKVVRMTREPRRGVHKPLLAFSIERNKYAKPRSQCYRRGLLAFRLRFVLAFNVSVLGTDLMSDTGIYLSCLSLRFTAGDFWLAELRSASP